MNIIALVSDDRNYITNYITKRIVAGKPGSVLLCKAVVEQQLWDQHGFHPC